MSQNATYGLPVKDTRCRRFHRHEEPLMVKGLSKATRKQALWRRVPEVTGTLKIRDRYSGQAGKHCFTIPNVRDTTTVRGEIRLV